MDNLTFDAILYETDTIFKALQRNIICVHKISKEELIHLLELEERTNDFHVACFPYLDVSENKNGND